MKVSIDDIRIKEGRRRLDTGHVKELADSIRELGLLNPVTIDKENTLIAGLHRLEAARLLGWTEVECAVSSLEGLKAELAEIDENIVRSGLSAVEYGETLLRRKEIYEALHPETKHGGDRKSEEIKRTKCPLDSAMSFVDDTAEKLGVAPRTVRRQIQTAKNLTPEAKEIIRDTDTKLSKKEAMKLSRMGPEQQKEAAGMLAAKEIKSVDEYAGMAEKKGKAEAGGGRAEKNPGAAPEEMPGKGMAEEMAEKGTEAGKTRENMPEKYGQKPAGTEGNGQEPVRKAGMKEQKEDAQGLDMPAVKEGASLREIVADLKNMDKDCSGTPESFLAEFDAFVGKFRREIEWYDNPYYFPVFPQMSERQFADFRKQADSIHAAVDRLYEKIERMMKDGKQ